MEVPFQHDPKTAQWSQEKWPENQFILIFVALGKHVMWLVVAPLHLKKMFILKSPNNIIFETTTHHLQLL